MAKADSTQSGQRHAIVTFDRAITQDDLRALQSNTDALEAQLAPIDIDSDHVHGAPE
jgi:hypothetical protein